MYKVNYFIIDIDSLILVLFMSIFLSFIFLLNNEEMLSSIKNSLFERK